MRRRLTGTEEVMVVQSGTSRRTTTAEIAQTGAVVYANPTGTVGLSVVNGVAVTAMRSDAAPPLSQSIAPTWTGAHTPFRPAVALDGVTTVGGTSINSTGLFTSGVLGVPRGGARVSVRSRRGHHLCVGRERAYRAPEGHDADPLSLEYRGVEQSCVGASQPRRWGNRQSFCRASQRRFRR